MKNNKLIRSQWDEQLHERWKALPVYRQRRIMLCSFMAYVLITAITITYCILELHATEPQVYGTIENPFKGEKQSTYKNDKNEKGQRKGTGYLHQ